MTEHDLSAGGDVMDRVRGCARDALAAYGGHPGALLTAGGTTPPDRPDCRPAGQPSRPSPGLVEPTRRYASAGTS